MKNIIIVTRRSDDFHACLKYFPEIWGCGKTEYEAIGSLVNAYQDKFKVIIKYE